MRLIAGSLGALAVVAGCAAPHWGFPAGSPPPTASTTDPAVPGSPGSPDTEADSVGGAIVRFAAGDAAVDVTIDADNPTSRDFLSRLPLTLTLEECQGREKIGYLFPELETAGSPGSDPEDGDLIYYAPWGNLAFFYDADGVGYSDQTIRLGTYDASPAQLGRLEGGDVMVEVVE